MASFEELKALVDAGNWQRLVELGMPRTLIGRENIWLYGYNPETGNAFTPEEQQPFAEQNNAGYKKVGNKTYGPGDIIPGESLQDYAARFAEMGGGQFAYKGKSYLMNRRGQYYEIGTPEPQGFGDTEENLGNLYYGSVKQIKGAAPAKVIDPTRGKVIGYDSSGNLLYESSKTVTGPIPGKTVTKTTANADGTTSYLYTDGTTSIATPAGVGGNDPLGTGSAAGGLAINTFKNTLALFFGQTEMTKPWVSELYKLVNPYYKSGSSVDEALNMAIQEGRNNPNLKEFTARFKGIYDLQDKLLKGAAVTVPTIAEFIASEAKMGDVLNQAGLSSLNQQSYLGDIIGKGVNVTEFTNRINNVFLRIDQLPQQAKDFISGSFPTLDKTQLAKAILGGDKGAIELSKELSGMEVQAAGKAQGIGVTTATGLDIAARGFGYQEALTGFGTVAQSLPTYEKLQEISSGKDIKTEQAQTELQGLVFNKSIADSMRAEQLANQEVARFRSSSGIAGSKSLASQQRGAGLI